MKASVQSKTVGSRKLRSDQSSSKSFCKGVPAQ